MKIMFTLVAANFLTLYWTGGLPEPPPYIFHEKLFFGPDLREML
jgi:hypothetical protein